MTRSEGLVGLCCAMNYDINFANSEPMPVLIFNIILGVGDRSLPAAATLPQLTNVQDTLTGDAVLSSVVNQCIQ